MAIELYGLPASGKTHFRNELIATGEYELADVAGRWQLLKYSVLFWLKYPRFSWALFRFMLRHTHTFSGVYTKAVNGLGHRLARHIVPTKKTRIVDEGAVHNLFALSDDLVSEREIGKLVSLLPSVTDEYIRVHAPRETRKKRIRERGHQFTREKDPGRVRMLEDVTIQNEKRVHELLKAHAGENVREAERG